MARERSHALYIGHAFCSIFTSMTGKRFCRSIVLVAVAALTGCATVEKPYIPAKLGNLEDDQAYDGIRMQLMPDHFQAKIGELLTFSIILKNVSSQPIWIPKDPDFLLTWVYPDGKRDNIVKGD